MNSETYNDISATASNKFASALAEDAHLLSRHVRRELAAETVRAEIATMEAAGKVLQLTDEEIRLLRSFRAYRLKAKPGKVFRWQLGELELGVLLVPDQDPVLIQDPQDVSR